ncbi:hypothetical protein C0993_010151, partial [Termitomyces sp. T159_Od127]
AMVYAGSLMDAIVSKLVERIEPVAHHMASSVDFVAANGLTQAVTTLSLKNVSAQLQTVTSLLNEVLTKAKAPSPTAAPA